MGATNNLLMVSTTGGRTLCNLHDFYMYIHNLTIFGHEDQNQVSRVTICETFTLLLILQMNEYCQTIKEITIKVFVYLSSTSGFKTLQSNIAIVGL